MLGDRDSCDPVARALAARAQCTVVSADYRLAPEHPFPAAVDDAWAVLTWADENRGALAGPGAPLAVFGESAGANLAASVALRWGVEGRRSLALQALLYPPFDPTCGSASQHALAEGPVLTRAAMLWFWRQYAPDAGLWRDPRLSPACAPDLARAPAAFVQTAEFDPLRDEGEAYARRLAAAGVPTQFAQEAGLTHGFATLAALAPSVDAALDRAAAALRAALVAAAVGGRRPGPAAGQMCRPPSIGSTAPVMKAAAGEQRNSCA